MFKLKRINIGHTRILPVLSSMDRLNVEDILPAVRAVLASELVEKQGLNRRRAANALDITPAAITQYLKGVRASQMVKRIAGSRELKTFIAAEASKLANSFRVSGQSVSFTELVDISYQVLILLTGQTSRRPINAKSDKIREWIELLRERLQAEQLAAQRSMGYAMWSQNELVKTLFHQIASDSLRHADICSSLITYLESGGLKSLLEAPDTKELRRIIAEEEKADDPHFLILRNIGDPAVKLLVESVEADERKHLRLLRGLLKIKASKTSSTRKGKN